MTRLQKKCLIAAAGTHLLVVVVVLCSGFITPTPTPNPTDTIIVIPANVLDNVLNSGVSSAQLPPPKPMVKLPEPTPPVPEPPKPPVTPPQPKPEPPPEDVKQPEKNPDAEIPKPKPPKPKHEIKVDMTVRKLDPKKGADDTAAEVAKAEKEAKRIRDQKLKAFQNAARNISQKSSSATQVEMPGTGSVSFANYASVVRSVYEQAWIAPDNADNDDAIVKVSVTIARDGQVVSARIVNASGDSKVDSSIQRTLDRVKFIREFPADAKEQEKTFIINFNLKAKRMLS